MPSETFDSDQIKEVEYEEHRITSACPNCGQEEYEIPFSGSCPECLASFTVTGVELSWESDSE